MLRLVLELGPEAVDELEMVGILGRPGRRAARGRPRRPPVGRSAPRPRGLDPDTTPQAADDPRQGQALPDEGRQDHAQGQVDQQRAVRDVCRQRRAPPRARRPRASPPSEMTKIAPDGGVGSRARSFALTSAGCTSPGRPTRSGPGSPSALIASPSPISVAGGNSASASRIPGSWTPISRNANPLIRKIEHGPDPGAHEPRVRREGACAVPAGDDPGGDGREDAADPQRHGRQVGGERDEERDHDLERRVRDPPPDADEEEPDERPRSRSLRPP